MITNWFMQMVGFRYIYYDWAFSSGIPLEIFEGYEYHPDLKKGYYKQIDPLNLVYIGNKKR